MLRRAFTLLALEAKWKRSSPAFNNPLEGHRDEVKSYRLLFAFRSRDEEPCEVEDVAKMEEKFDHEH